MSEVRFQMVTQPTVISTFAGCGGSSLGYKFAGFRELLAVEWDANAVLTFRLNFPGVPVWHGDIAKLTGAGCLRIAGIKAGELDVFDGSPPCQGFSTAGKRQFSDPRNSLFKEFARLLAEIQPKVFVMENVTGMVRGVMKQAYLQIVKTLREAGYRVKGEVLNAMYFNVPQSRERVIIIGVRNDLGIEPSHPKPETESISVQEAWKDLLSQQVPPLSRCFLEAVPKMKQGQSVADVTGGTKHFQTVRIHSHLPCPTLTKIKGGVGFGSHIHPTENRVLSILEMKRVSTFPDEFKFTGNYAEQRSRMGNSVPPNLMRAIAEHVRRQILDRIGQ